MTVKLRIDIGPQATLKDLAFEIVRSIPDDFLAGQGLHNDLQEDERKRVANKIMEHIYRNMCIDPKGTITHIILNSVIERDFYLIKNHWSLSSIKCVIDKRLEQAYEDLKKEITYFLIYNKISKTKA